MKRARKVGADKKGKKEEKKKSGKNASVRKPS